MTNVSLHIKAIIMQQFSLSQSVIFFSIPLNYFFTVMQLYRLHMHKSVMGYVGVCYLLQHPVLGGQHHNLLHLHHVPVPFRGKVWPVAMAQAGVLLLLCNGVSIHMLLNFCNHDWWRRWICCWGMFFFFTFLILFVRSERY